MTTAMDWQGDVGRTWAEMYRLTDRSFAGLTQVLLDRLAGLPGEAVLDVGCGAGELALALARCRPEARIIGLDVSDDLVAAARERGAQLSNAEFVHGDAARWRREGFAPDLLVSRHGVMFFADPVAAFAHLRSIAVPGARLLFSCFRTPRENLWLAELNDLLPASSDALPADPHAPGPFAFADPRRVEAILGAAGWRDIAIAPQDFAYVAGTGDDPVGDAAAFFTRIGPAAATLRELPEAMREPMRARMRAWLEAQRSGSLVAFSAGAWIVSAAN